jgi:hypothetical protein
MRARADTTQHLRSFVVTALAVGLVAAPIAVLWAHVVPHAGLVVVRGGGVVLGGQEDEFVRADGWFIIMTAIVGLLCGLVTWWLTSGRDPGAVVGLAAGSIFAAFAVARIGAQHNTGRLHLDAAARRLGVTGPLHGHYPPLAHGALFVWAFAALFAYAVLAALVGREKP